MKMNFCLSLLLIVSSFFGLNYFASAKVKPADLKQLTGVQWKGTLTYLDYGRNRKVSIPSNLVVTQSSADKRTWIFEYQYPDEPKANSKDNVTLSEDGRTFDGEEVVERTTLPGKTLKIVTTKSGTDNDKPALFRYTYLISAKSFYIRKEVRYEGASEYFERNEYSWRREP